MRIYAVYYTQPDGCFRIWCRSSGDAVRERARLVREKIAERSSTSIEEHDIVPNKEGILHALNKYASADNG